MYAWDATDPTHPVITDSRRAADVLDWAVERMEQRYQLLSEKGVRNIESYNEKIDKELAAATPRNRLLLGADQSPIRLLRSKLTVAELG